MVEHVYWTEVAHVQMICTSSSNSLILCVFQLLRVSLNKQPRNKENQIIFENDVKNQVHSPVATSPVCSSAVNVTSCLELSFN